MPHIKKVALVTIDSSNHILLLKKKGLDTWILPGGKIEEGETEKECLKRELQEEINTGWIGSLGFALTCQDIATGTIDTNLELIVYYANLAKSSFVVSNEIEFYVWADIYSNNLPVANSLKYTIMPWFRECLAGRNKLKFPHKFESQRR